jgi:hypothetical protein
MFARINKRQARIWKGKTMRVYVCFYKSKKITVEAENTYAAQIKAASVFKARKSYDVAVVLADVLVNTASI